MQITHFYHRHHFHRLAGHTNFRLFELGIWLHSLAQSLVWVFVPIILLRTGYSVTNILIFYLIFNIIDVPLNFVAAYLMRVIGARKVLLLGIGSVIVFFILLNFLSFGNWPLLILLAFLAAVYDTFFWVSHIYIFIEINREKGLDAGNTTGALEATRKLANVIGPIVGAILLTVFGKASLLVFSIMLNALAISVLFKMRHIADIPKGTFSFRGFFTGLKEKRDFISMAFWGVHNEVDSILWPLFIFIVFGSIGSVAAVPVIVSLTTAIFSYIAGRLTKKYSLRMIAMGSALIALTWVLRVVFENGIFYYATVFFIGFFSLLVIIPIDRSIVESGLNKGSLAASTYRNAVAMFSRIPLYIILLFLLEVFKVSFGLAAVSVFAVLFVTLILNQRLRMMAL